MREEDVLLGEIALVTGLEEASEVGRDPERGEIGCWLRVCLWHTAEVIPYMLGGRCVAVSLGVIRYARGLFSTGTSEIAE